MRCAAARDFSLPAFFSSPARPRISHRSPPAHPRCSLVEREKDCFAVYFHIDIADESQRIQRVLSYISPLRECQPTSKVCFPSTSGQRCPSTPHEGPNTYEGYSSTYTAHLSRLRLCTFSVRSNNPKKAISAVSVISRSNDQW